ncbi:spore coat protein CotF [Paenibacillus shirakamiensis]|uniref:Spore coat protein CotF n=1 Tax=Paenibacillus shirakamiensis TaxID=1265935 RepID=A0ABS4JLU2_9BACL|nr:spore coat protein CotF [Paenibacillus shirakamiensis]
MHELVASKANQLTGLKMSINHVTDPNLRNLYQEAITALTQNIQELLQYYPHAPTMN